MQRITFDLGTRALADGGEARFTLEIDPQRFEWLIDHIEQRGGYTTLADRAIIGRMRRVAAVCRGTCRALGAQGVLYDAGALCVACGTFIARAETEAAG